MCVEDACMCFEDRRGGVDRLWQHGGSSAVRATLSLSPSLSLSLFASLSLVRESRARAISGNVGRFSGLPVCRFAGFASPLRGLKPCKTSEFGRKWSFKFSI